LRLSYRLGQYGWRYGCPTHGKHGNECHDKGDKGHGYIHRPQRRRTDTLPDKDAVYYVVKIGHK
jgi:hypothetical protein